MKLLTKTFILAGVLSAFTTASSFAITVYSDDFSTNQGWTLGTKWEIGSATASPGATGNPDPSVDHTATADNGVLGGDIGGNIGGTDGGLHGFYWATSAVINASNLTDANLSFYRWLNTDYLPFMESRVEGWDGSSWQLIWGNGEDFITDNAWNLNSFDVSALAAGNSQFQVRFGWNVGSGGVYTISGWNVDDLTVSGTAAASSVPDGGSTIALLGLALTAVAGARRKFGI